LYSSFTSDSSYLSENDILKHKEKARNS